MSIKIFPERKAPLTLFRQDGSVEIVRGIAMARYYSQNYRKTLLIVFMFTALAFGCAGADMARAENAKKATAATQRIAQAVQKREAVFFDKAALEAFYAQRGGKLLWTAGGRGAKDSIRRILAGLENAETHGLNPEQYHVAQIRAYLDGMSKDKTLADLLISDGLMHYGHDLGGMRIDPKTIKQKADYWRQAPPALDILQKVASADNPMRAVESFAPRNDFYEALRRELARLSREESGYDSVLPMNFGGSNHFTPGSRHKDVAALRVRLGVPYVPEYGPESYYDDETASAVMTFQRAHGLEPDGIIGPQTLSVLNRTQRERREQIIANMERQRWLDQEKPDRYILVNIPQQLLWAVDRNRVVHEMKVVVGMPSRRTKEFKAEVKGVRFNPNWTVPIGIKMADFLPKLRNDPGYLSEKGIEIIKGHGAQAVTLDPYAIDWQSVGSREMNQMRFVQNPGDNNALGAVRILMPNDYNIYMHDTNHPEYFARGQRTYSSGCIRLAEPEKIANFVLAQNGDWSPTEMPGIIASGKTTEIMASKSFPVYIVYQTMWLDGNGRLVYGPDVYRRDRDLLEVLRRMKGYRFTGTEPDQRFAAAGKKSPSSSQTYND